MPLASTSWELTQASIRQVRLMLAEVCVFLLVSHWANTFTNQWPLVRIIQFGHKINLSHISVSLNLIISYCACAHSSLLLRLNLWYLSRRSLGWRSKGLVICWTISLSLLWLSLSTCIFPSSLYLTIILSRERKFLWSFSLYCFLSCFQSLSEKPQFPSCTLPKSHLLTYHFVHRQKKSIPFHDLL